MKTIKFIPFILFFLFASSSIIKAQDANINTNGEYQVNFNPYFAGEQLIRTIYIHESEAIKGFSIRATPPGDWNGQISCPIRFQERRDGSDVILTLSSDVAYMEFEGSAGGSLDICFAASGWSVGSSGASTWYKYHILRLVVVKG